MYPYNFISLSAKELRSEKLSDHQPVIDGDVVSWNIMMQCKFTAHNRYNNGFLLEETQAQYQERLKKVAFVLAHMCSMQPHINIICLQEAPIIAADINVFVEAAMSYPSLHKFAKTLFDPKMFTAWGLLTLLNTKVFEYEKKLLKFEQAHVPISIQSIEDRVQCFSLTALSVPDRRLINLHFPFDLSKKYPGKMARLVSLIAAQQQKEKATHFIIAGDFNFRITQFPAIKELGHVLMPLHNSTEFECSNGGSNTLETVDAIIRAGTHELNNAKLYTKKLSN